MYVAYLENLSLICESPSSGQLKRELDRLNIAGKGDMYFRDRLTKILQIHRVNVSCIVNLFQTKYAPLGSGLRCWCLALLQNQNHSEIQPFCGFRDLMPGDNHINYRYA
jgi:hypothetical protein